MNAMMHHKTIDGLGAVFVDDAGRVRIFVSDSCGEAFDAAAANGVSADELIDGLLAQAEASRAMGATIAPHREVHIQDVVKSSVHHTNRRQGHGEHVDRCESRRVRHSQRLHKRYS